MRKRLVAFFLVLGLAVVGLAPAALAAQKGSVMTGNGTCQALANGATLALSDQTENVNAHDRGLHRAHQQATKVSGKTDCT